MIGSADEFIALRTSSDPTEQARASQDEAPDDVWRAVIREHPDMCWWVAQNKTVSVSILAVLATDPDARVRSMVAQKRKLGVDLIERLAHDPDESVRQHVAANRTTPAMCWRCSRRMLGVG
jgi:hypothetical protein